MGVALIKRVNIKYTKLWMSICNYYSFNFDVYPKKLHDTYTSYKKTTAVALTKLVNMMEVEDKKERDR